MKICKGTDRDEVVFGDLAYGETFRFVDEGHWFQGVLCMRVNTEQQNSFVILKTGAVIHSTRTGLAVERVDGCFVVEE